MKDAFAMVLFLILFAWFVFYQPDYLGHPDNYIEANPLKTPNHIVPEWYFLPFYAILRAITFNISIPFTDVVLIDSKLGGVIAMFASILVLFFLPWLDTSKVRSAKYRPLYRQFFWIFVAVCIFLGWLGSKPAEGIYPLLALIGTIYYFAHFLLIMPWLGWVEKTRPVPASIADAVLAK
jgi:ubiquinol-cytochrome c reductase cytochrome b subunit